MKFYFPFLFLLFGIQYQIFGQNNDECVNNILLEDVSNYCSAVGQFSNSTGSLSPQTNPTCWPQENVNDVWFSFKALGTDVTISVKGAVGNNAGGTLQSPQFALYSGDCTNLTEIQCFSDAFNADLAESNVNQLVVGQTYYIRVGARNGNTGTFQLCVTNFNAVPDPSSDCPTAVVLCDKQSFTVESLTGVGTMTNELANDDCIGQEFSSAWYKWTCDEAGSLSFILTPTNPNDDLDFSVYELPNGIDDCSGKQLLRCVASGENVGQPFSQWEICTGATGLSSNDGDTSEDPGCQNGDNNFASALNMESGKSYALIVNNFSQSGNGFTIEFGGSGTFLGPQPEFTISPDEGTQCDIDVIEFTSSSSIPLGFSAGYQWFFGEGATPQNANTEGPHEVTYSSFGVKTILLQVTTEEGCIVTTVQEIFIESCCPPDADLDINATEINDPPCANEATGSFTVEGTGGVPAYQYSLNGTNFQSGSEFTFVSAGDYNVYIVDTKGCLDSVDVRITDPTPLLVDAGPDFEVDLGETVVLNGSLISSNGLTDLPIWSPASHILEDSLTYDPLVLPLGTTDYILSVTDDLGCTATDTATVFVALVRPVYIPSAFSPNDDGVNDFFTLYGGAGALRISDLKIFNRWGGLVFQGTDLMLNQESVGWNGEYKGEDLGSDVFVYVAEVDFIDGISVLYKGDITLIR